MNQDEAVEILEQLAREGPDYVRVSAIRALLRLDEDEGEAPPTGFDRLDEPRG